MAAVLNALWGLLGGGQQDTERGRHRTRQAPGQNQNRIEFFGSQMGGESVINYSYTDMPWNLMMWDIRYFLTFAWALPWIIWPMRPCDSDHFDELSVTYANVWCVFVHSILLVIHTVFILSIPFIFLFPVWLVIFGWAAFFTFNWLLCLTLNGRDLIYHSDPKYAEYTPANQHEQWIYLNGVAAGQHWLQSNINRLALTFKRPVIGIHNQTDGILFDVIECLIQRNFGYATKDVREAYRVVKEKLYNPQYSKIVFILHSQGGIEGGLAIDWLIQELPQDLLAKLEVYTFGNAANHFNNPHRHSSSLHFEKKHPQAMFSGQTTTQTHIVESPVDVRTQPTSGLRNGTTVVNGVNGVNGTHGVNGVNESSYPASPPRTPGLTTTSRASITTSDRVLAHVEHYAHTTDFVALWGVLHFVTNARSSPQLPRFIGRVFSRQSSRGGHQFCQHYLNGMFPLARDEHGDFVGCAETNEFMESEVVVGREGSEHQSTREEFEHDFAMLQGESPLDNRSAAVFGSFHQGEQQPGGRRVVQVKDLSRLWLYRNGRSPPGELPNGVRSDASGLARGTTL